MKRIITAALLSTAILAAPVAEAASGQDRAMATGAVIGATSGAVIGSSHNQTLEGAFIGAVFGTIAGAVIGSQSQPTHVVHQPRRHYHKPVVHHREHRAYSRSYDRHDRHNRYNRYDHERGHRD